MGGEIVAAGALIALAIYWGLKAIANAIKEAKK